jgi:2',3'-cyclic-nucleotide 2'-phosphodiesterase (5'-nucleotidase family)
MFDNSETADVKNNAYMEAFNKLNMTAINISEREMYVGYSKILEYQKKAKFDFLAANIVYEKSEKPAFKTHTIIVKNIPTIGKIKIGVIGLTRYVASMWETDKQERLKVTDFVKVTKEIVNKIRKEVDLIIVLAHFDRNDAKYLVEQVPGIDIILASFGSDRTIEPYKINNTEIYYNGFQGRWVGELRIFLDKKKKIKSIINDYIYLDKQYPSDEEMNNFVEITNQKASDELVRIRQEQQKKAMEEAEKRRKEQESQQQNTQTPSQNPEENKPPK